MNEDDVLNSARDYVELEADTDVLGIEIVDSFSRFGQPAYVLVAETTNEENPEWWVVAGETPTNLYPKPQFENPDHVYSFHRGIMSRMAERQFQQTDEPPEGEKYDVFVCHSSKDKDEFVEPLVREMKRRGDLVWYDDDELGIGDSIRQSIDEGLAHAHTGVVVLSETFFDRDWTEYELNGLITKDIGESLPSVFPVWYRIGKSDVMEYSPPLADRKAVVTDGTDIERVARVLTEAVNSKVRDEVF